MIGQVNDPEHTQKIAVSGYLLLLYPLVVALTIVGIVLVWNVFPDSALIRYGTTFNTDSFASKVFEHLIPMIVPQCLLAIMFISIHFVIKHLPVEKFIFPFGKITPETEPKVRLAGSRWALVTGLLMVAGGGLTEILPLMGSDGGVVFVALMAVILVIVIGGPIVFIRELKKLGELTKELSA
jgi:hypothetical protein